MTLQAACLAQYWTRGRFSIAIVGRREGRKDGGGEEGREKQTGKGRMDLSQEVG